ncbi:MAG: carbohydrate ABC transporter permease [Omnitrophica WOR_2 bacterium]
MAIRVLTPPTTVKGAIKSERVRPRTWQGWVIEVTKYAVLLLLGLSYLLPLYWMISSSLKDDAQVYVVPPVWIPNPAHWENFWSAWTKYPFTDYLINTVFRYALPVMVGTVLSSAIVAYGFSRLRWKGRDTLFAICLGTMMVPFQVTMVSLFIIFRKMGWLNTYLPLTVPAFFGNPYFIFLLRQFFRTIPDELTDAARIDGANDLDILFRILLPLSTPALTVVALFAFMGAWNDYLGPLVYLNNSTQYPLSIGIQSMRLALAMKAVGKSNAYPYLMAVSTVVTLPILVAFFFAQRTFIEGITLTGLKG